MQSFKSPLFLLALVGIFLLFLQLPSINKGVGTDFGIYNAAAKAFRTNATTLYTSSSADFSQFLYPPPAITLFVLLSYIPETIAYNIFIIFIFSLLVTSLHLWKELCKREGIFIGKEETWLMVLFLAASAPFVHNLVLGQINTLVLLLSLLFLYFLKKRPLLAGIFLAAAIWIKIYPVLFVFWALFSVSGRKSLVSCFISGVLMAAVLLPWIPLQLYSSFAHKLAEVAQFTSAHVINQSATGFFTRFCIPYEKIFSWPNIYLVPEWVKWANYVLLGAGAVWVIGVTAKRGSIVLPGAFLLAFIPVFSTLGWGHTYVFAFPLLMVWFHLYLRKFSGKPAGAVLIIAAGLLLLVPVHNTPGILKVLPFWVQNLYFSRLLLLTLLFITTVWICLKPRRADIKKL